MHGLHGVHENRGRTRAGQCGGDLLPHVAAFAHPGHDDLAVPVERLHARGNELDESVAELVAHGGEPVDFDVEDLVRFLDHGLCVHFHCSIPRLGSLSLARYCVSVNLYYLNIHSEPEKASSL